MNQIPCEVIRDLFPSYIEGLTSEVSNQMIEDHLKECEECSEVLRTMRSPGNMPEKLSELTPEEQQEIDFLKKNKRRNRRIVTWSIVGALALVFFILLARILFIGDRTYTNWTAMNLEVHDNELAFRAVPMDSASAIAGFTYTEDAGIVTVHARSVLVSPLYSGSRQGSYTAKKEIREVRIGDRIVWSEGATVSAQASALFTTRHAFVGDMSANNRTAAALNIAAYLGPFTNELKTAAEPYEWWILLENEVPIQRLEQKKRDMEAFGQVLIGLIGNLDRVVFLYTVEGGGPEEEYAVTAVNASNFLGEDIKNCGDNIRTLDRLLEKNGLSLYAAPEQAESAENAVWIEISSQQEKEIDSFCFSYYKDGALCSSGGAVNADGSAIKAGESMWIDVSAMDFGGEWNTDAVLEIELGIEFTDGTSATIPSRIRITPDTGTVQRFRLTGNAWEGYRLEQ